MLRLLHTATRLSRSSGLGIASCVAPFCSRDTSPLDNTWREVDVCNDEMQELFGHPLDAGPSAQPHEPAASTSDAGAFPPPSALPHPGEAGHTATPPPSLTGAAPSSSRLTHVDDRGSASMVDVSDKRDTVRTATASARVTLGPEVFDLVERNQLKKGDVLRVAQIAGIQGAKQTPALIPLCHHILLSKVDVQLDLDAATHAVHIRGVARAVGPTGVEMEALTAVSVAALTVYDMCKAASKGITISTIQLEDKSGGKSGDYLRGRE